MRTGATIIEKNREHLQPPMMAGGVWSNGYFFLVGVLVGFPGFVGVRDLVTVFVLVFVATTGTDVAVRVRVFAKPAVAVRVSVTARVVGVAVGASATTRYIA